MEKVTKKPDCIGNISSLFFLFPPASYFFSNPLATLPELFLCPGMTHHIGNGIIPPPPTS